MVEMKLTKTQIKKINKELIQSLQIYRKNIAYMEGDAPIGVLCLPKSLEAVLLKNGISRVYDLFGRDLTKIKGIGKRRIGDLTASLDQFLPMR
jgi:hypothetical protein